MATKTVSGNADTTESRRSAAHHAIDEIDVGIRQARAIGHLLCTSDELGGNTDAIEAAASIRDILARCEQQVSRVNLGLGIDAPTTVQSSALTVHPAAGLNREGLLALIEAQKASDAIQRVLAGMEDTMHAHGLSGGVWAIESILQTMGSKVDPGIEAWQENVNTREAANG